MQGLFDCLTLSNAVTVEPALQEDFLDYNKLFQDIYHNLAGKDKLNHIFSVSNDNTLAVIHLLESNLDEHPILLHARR